jgi:tRNA 2-thiouridine synthesizing protein A
MSHTMSTVTVAELVRTDPRLRAIFETFGINHCCAGHVSLSQAAAASGVPLDTLLAALRAAEGGGEAAILDVRGLEPPQPMLRVLERVATLAPGETLTVIHDRRPIFLYPQLEQRGLSHETDEPEAGVVRIRIRRGA